MNSTFNQIVVGFILMSMNESTKTGTLRVDFTSKTGKKSSSILHDVYISGLARHRVTKGQILMHHLYESKNNSESYTDNPFTLLRTVNKEGKLIFILKCVEEKGSKDKETILPNGQIHKGKLFFFHKKSEYKRYLDVYENTKKRVEEKYQTA